MVTLARPKRPVVDLETTGVPEAPSSPENLKEAGLSMGLLTDMILRTLYQRGTMLGLDLARFLCLPFKIVEEGIRFLKDEKCIEVMGGDLIGRVSYKFTLTDLNSRNGTYVRIKSERELAHGDYLFIGRKLLRVELNTN